jgi:hypothetical protein
MDPFKKLTRVLVPAAVIVLVWYREAYAYIDPSAGSYFLQLVISAVVGGLFAAKTFWKNLRSQGGRKRSKGHNSKGNDSQG